MILIYFSLTKIFKYRKGKSTLLPIFFQAARLQDFRGSQIMLLRVTRMDSAGKKSPTVFIGLHLVGVVR